MPKNRLNHLVGNAQAIEIGAQVASGRVPAVACVTYGLGVLAALAKWDLAKFPIFDDDGTSSKPELPITYVPVAVGQGTVF